MQVLDRLSRPGCEHYETLRFTFWLQWHLHRQLRDASAYAAEHRVALKGDLPIGAPALVQQHTGGGAREQRSWWGRLGGVPVPSKRALLIAHRPCWRARARGGAVPARPSARAGRQAWTRRAWTRGSTRTCSTWASRPARRRTTLTPTARTGASPRTTGRRWRRTATPGGARACPSWPRARPPGPRAVALARLASRDSVQAVGGLQGFAASGSTGPPRARRLPVRERRGGGAARPSLARAARARGPAGTSTPSASTTSSASSASGRSPATAPPACSGTSGPRTRSRAPSWRHRASGTLTGAPPRRAPLTRWSAQASACAAGQRAAGRTRMPASSPYRVGLGFGKVGRAAASAGPPGEQAVRAVHHARAAEERLRRAGGGGGLQVSGGGAARPLPLPRPLCQVPGRRSPRHPAVRLLCGLSHGPRSSAVRCAADARRSPPAARPAWRASRRGRTRRPGWRRSTRPRAPASSSCARTSSCCGMRTRPTFSTRHAHAPGASESLLSPPVMLLQRLACMPWMGALAACPGGCRHRHMLAWPPPGAAGLRCALGQRGGHAPGVTRASAGARSAST